MFVLRTFNEMQNNPTKVEIMNTINPRNLDTIKIIMLKKIKVPIEILV